MSFASVERHKQRIMKYRKKLLKELKINGCAICGYNKCNLALEFHHVISEDKEFKINESQLYNNDDRIIDEIHKCILLCRNCHAEIHALEKENEK